MARRQGKHKITIFALMGLVLIHASTLSANATKGAEVERAEGFSKREVELRFDGQRLLDAMAEVTRRSGVRIVVAPELVHEKIEVAIKQTDWHAAIKSLLKSFDHIAIVDRSGSYRKIWITGRKVFASAVATVDGVTPGRFSRFDTGAERDRPADPEPERSMELPVAIWEPLEPDTQSFDADGTIPSEPVQSDPALFETIRVGQPLEILIPQEEFPLFAVVGETHSRLNGEIQVWSGPIDGSHETASFTITRGEVTTYITVATGTSIYEVSVDNATGLGQVVNEVDLTKGKTDQDFLVPEETGTSPSPDEL